MSQDKTVETQELIAHGRNLSTIAATSVTINFSVSETNKQSKALIAKAMDKEDTPLQDPPSIFLNNASISTPLFFTPIEKGEKEMAKSQDLIIDNSNSPTAADPIVEEQKARLTVVSLGFENLSATICAQPPFDAIPTVRTSGSQLWFDFIVLTPNPICSSCFEFEKFSLAITRMSPEKTGGNHFHVRPWRNFHRCLPLLHAPPSLPSAVSEASSSVGDLVFVKFYFDFGFIFFVVAKCVSVTRGSTLICHQPLVSPAATVASTTATLCGSEFGTRNKVSRIENGLAEALMFWASKCTDPSCH